MENISASNPALSHLQAGGLSEQQSYGLINRLVDQQAFMLSADDIFFVSALLFLALVVVIWFARPERAGGDARGGGSAAAASGAH